MSQASPFGAVPAGRAEEAFATLKRLVGEWRGQRPDSGEIIVTYRLSARDSVLVETWNLGPGWESLTIYHMNGSELLATHFCPQGNQPRLRLWQVAGTRLDFAILDATGVEAGQGVQHAFWIDMAADGTITRSETYVQGENSETETITYSRIRTAE